MSSVDCYNINIDQWFEAPPVHKERADASSCEQGDFIYTFGGLKFSAGYQLADIERLNAIQFTQQKRNNAGSTLAWELMNITTEDTIILTRRENAVMAPLNERQILILGGDGESGFKSDAYILNTETSSIHQVSPDLGFRVCTWSN